MNCSNCYYKAINPDDDEGHCYMFEKEPVGDCLQFKLSFQARTAIDKVIDTLN
jgi:hypothetical protein